MKKIYLASLLMLSFGAVNAQSVSGEMETWRNYNSGIVNPTSLEAPQGWYGVDSTVAYFSGILGSSGAKQIYKSTDKHGGTYAARIVSRTQPLLGIVFPGIMTNAKITVNIADTSFTSSGGTPVNQRIGTMTVWAKYNPKATSDSATLGIQAVLAGRGAGGADSVVGEGTITIGAKANYTQFVIPLTYVTPSVVPDHVQIAFTSSGDSPADSSELYVDDVSILAASGISQALMNASVIKCYPNPTTGALYLTSNEPETLTWEALNTTGQVIAQKEFIRNATVQLNNMPSGVYYYRVFDKRNTLVQTGKFNLQ